MIGLGGAGTGIQSWGSEPRGEGRLKKLLNDEASADKKGNKSGWARRGVRKGFLESN